MFNTQSYKTPQQFIQAEINCKLQMHTHTCTQDNKMKHRHKHHKCKVLNTSGHANMLCSVSLLFPVRHGYPGLGVPVPLLIVYLISYLTLSSVKISFIVSRDPKSVKSLAQVWLCVGLVVSFNHCCTASATFYKEIYINTNITTYNVNG